MAKAFTCIFINLSTEIQEACMHITTASELWTWIKNKFGQSTVSEEYQLYLDWENYHFDGGSVHTFGTGYQSKLDALKDTKLKISPAQARYKLLAQLTPHFQQWAVTKREQMRTLTEEELDSKMSVDNMINEVVDEEFAHQQQAALIARQRSVKPPGGNISGGGGRSTKNNYPLCRHCDRTNHEESKCWNEHPELRPSKFGNRKENKPDSKIPTPPQQARANMAITPRLENVMLEEPEEDCDLFMARTSTVEAGEPPTTSVHVPEPTARALQSATSSTDWIVDSGASRHMTNSLELMVISKPCHVMVYLGEGSIAATRFGVIKLHLDCGPVMFSGVLYVPGLAANLLSTQMLRSKKVFYTTETQVLYKRLDDGSAKVIANIIERKGLPHLTMGTAV
jgi:hypothetical protein